MKRRIAEYSPPNRFTFHLSRTTRTAFLSILRDAEEGFRICSRWEGGNTPSRPSMCIPTRRPRMRAVYAKPARQAVPGESPFCSGIVCPLRDNGFPVRIVLTHRRCVVYKLASTASPEPFGFTEGAPMAIQSPPGSLLRSRPAPRLHSLTSRHI